MYIDEANELEKKQGSKGADPENLVQNTHATTKDKRSGKN